VVRDEEEEAAAVVEGEIYVPRTALQSPQLAITSRSFF